MGLQLYYLHTICLSMEAIQVLFLLLLLVYNYCTNYPCKYNHFDMCKYPIQKPFRKPSFLYIGPRLNNSLLLIRVLSHRTTSLSMLFHRSRFISLGRDVIGPSTVLCSVIDQDKYILECLYQFLCSISRLNDNHCCCKIRI